MSQMHLESTDVVVRLEDSLERFAAKATDSMQEFSSDAERIVDAMQDHVAESASSVERCEDELQHADEEDDIDGLIYALRVAEERFEKARFWQLQVTERLSTVAAAIGQCQYVVNTTITSAAAFLEQKYQKAVAYEQERLDNLSSVNEILASPVWVSDSQINRDIVAFNNAPSEIRKSLPAAQGRTWDKVWKQKVRNGEKLAGRVEGENYAIDKHLRHPDGKSVFLDYVDFENDVIIDYKSAQDVPHQKVQKKRHIEAYEAEYGRTPQYRYETYEGLTDAAKWQEIDSGL